MKLALLSFLAASFARAETPAGFTAVVSPFQACGTREILAPTGGYARYFAPLSTGEVQRLREQMKDLPVEIVAPVGFSVVPAAETEGERRDRAELTRLVLEQRRANLSLHAKFTSALRERCLAPVTDKASWPEEFPANCQPDRGGASLFQNHLRQLPDQVNAFRIYYALAAKPLEQARTRLWDPAAQIDTEFRSLTMLSLPGRRAPLNAFEYATATRFFYEEWKTILESLEQEQTALLANFENGFDPNAREVVRRRLENLRQALKMPPETGVRHALSLVDPGWQSAVVRRWIKAKFKFYQTALGILEQARVVGLVQGDDLRVNDLDQAYARMQSNQAEQTRMLDEAERAGVTLDELFRYTLPFEQILGNRRDLCGAATALYYRQSNASLRAQLATLAAFFGASAVLPPPLVIVGGAVAALHQLRLADQKITRTWNDVTSFQFTLSSSARAEDMVHALDERLVTTQGAILAIAMLKAIHFQRPLPKVTATTSLGESPVQLLRGGAP